MILLLPAFVCYETTRWAVDTVWQPYRLVKNTGRKIQALAGSIRKGARFWDESYPCITEALPG